MPPLPTGAVSVAALLPVVALVSVIPGFAQYPSELTIRSTTTLIQVSLTAQDTKGLPVADLRKDDFEVFDNGRQQRIATFVVESPAPAARLNPPDGVFSNQAVDSAESRGGYTAILLDLLDINEFGGPNAFGDQAFAQIAITRAIQERASTEKLALYLLDSAGLELICDFGTDRDVLMQRAAALTGRLPFERGLGGRYAQIGQGSAIGQVQLAPGAKTATIVAVQRAYRVLAHGRRSECAGENCGSSRARATQEGVDLGVVRQSRRDRNQ